MQNLKHVLGKYLLPIFLILAGIGLLAVASGQTNLYIYGGLGILFVGILSLLYVKGLIPMKLQIVLSIVFVLGAAFFAYSDYAVIQEEIDNIKRKELVKTHVVQRLKDIRKVQVAYHKEKGVYTNNWDTLMDFLNNGKVTLIKRLGALPDTVPTDEMARELGLIQKMPEGATDQEVIDMGIIVRDTLLVGVKGTIFNKDDAQDRKTPLKLDSLSYVPFSTHQFTMQTGTVESGGVTQPTILVKDPDPFDKQFQFGSLTEASTTGNWKE